MVSSGAEFGEVYVSFVLAGVPVREVRLFFVAGEHWEISSDICSWQAPKFPWRGGGMRFAFSRLGQFGIIEGTVLDRSRIGKMLLLLSTIWYTWGMMSIVRCILNKI